MEYISILSKIIVAVMDLFKANYGVDVDVDAVFKSVKEDVLSRDKQIAEDQAEEKKVMDG